MANTKMNQADIAQAQLSRWCLCAVTGDMARHENCASVHGLEQNYRADREDPATHITSAHGRAFLHLAPRCTQVSGPSMIVCFRRLIKADPDSYLR